MVLHFFAFLNICSFIKCILEQSVKFTYDNTLVYTLGFVYVIDLFLFSHTHYLFGDFMVMLFILYKMYILTLTLNLPITQNFMHL